MEPMKMYIGGTDGYRLSDHEKIKKCYDKAMSEFKNGKGNYDNNFVKGNSHVCDIDGECYQVEWVYDCVTGMMHMNVFKLI